MLITKYEKQRRYYTGRGSTILNPIVAGEYATILKINSQEAHIDMCSNLAWHLLSKRLASIVAQSSIGQNPSRVFDLFQPLMSIWYHIAMDFGNPPNLFRLIEASYIATASQEVTNMSQSSRMQLQTYRKKYQTKPKKDLADCSYLDAGMIGNLDTSSGEIIQHPVTSFTLDIPDQVLHRLSLFRYMLEKLQAEVENWCLIPLYSSKVICLKYDNGHLSFVDTISHAFLNSFEENLKFESSPLPILNLK